MQSAWPDTVQAELRGLADAPRFAGYGNLDLQFAEYLRWIKWVVRPCLLRLVRAPPPPHRARGRRGTWHPPATPWQSGLMGLERGDARAARARRPAGRRCARTTSGCR